MQNLITKHLDIWTAAHKTRSGVGRGSSNKLDLYGIKKLRELILELAVQGKLVPQNMNDEPASELLKQIATEKNRLENEEQLKTSAKEFIEEREYYIQLPHGWEFARLGNLAKFIDYRGKTPTKVEFGIPLITAKNVRFGYIDRRPAEYITESDYEVWMTRGFPRLNDVLFTTEAPLGNVALVDIKEKFALAQRVICFQLHQPDLAEFIRIAIMSTQFQAQLIENATGMTATGVKSSKLKEIPIVIPPLAEQHRIVAKVDELMAFCDQLEQTQSDNIAAHAQLVEALLASLTNSADHNELQGNWQRIAAHFDTLFTTEHSIDQLKQTILQLAVMGKLVPQNPNDEPASELKKKITAEKAQLIEEGKIKKEKPLPEITDEEKPFELPNGWEWARQDEISLLITKGSSPKWQGVSYTENENDVLFVTSENVGSYQLLLDSKKYVEKQFNKIEPRSILLKGDFLMNIVGGSIGRTAIFNIEANANINQAVCLIRIIESYLNPIYLLHFYNSEVCISYMFDKQVDNARANLSMGNIGKFLIPIPPKEEQHRIVTKVDELMALCDTLKTNIQNAKTIQLVLADALIESEIK